LFGLFQGVEFVLLSKVQDILVNDINELLLVDELLMGSNLTGLLDEFLKFFRIDDGKENAEVVKRISMYPCLENIG
jgi:hypothetical protein